MRALAAQIAFNLVERRLDPFEQFFHQVVIEVGHRLEQLAVRRTHALQDVAWDRALAVVFALARISLHVGEIDIT